MITLVQFPWSPYCIVQRRILEYAGTIHKIVNVPCTDRSLVWKWTRQRYYQVPIIKDGKNVIFETEDFSQVIAKYLDGKLNLGLFPREWAGIQNLIWCYIEGEVEGTAFKLNDIFFTGFVPESEQMDFIRFKERKFGRGCLNLWREQQAALQEQLCRLLTPFEQMLTTRPFLLAERPLFVDFDLHGVLANCLYSRHQQLPTVHNRLQVWYNRMSRLTRDA